MADEMPVADARVVTQPVRLMESEEELAFELRAAEGAIFTGGRFQIGIFAFVFASLAFAYFYLRTSNNQGLFRPGHVTAPTKIGDTIFAVTVVCGLLSALATQRLRRGLVLDWLVAGWMLIGWALFAFAFQIFELTQLPFTPGSSGYASCFVGWAVLNMGLLFGATYWSETVLARGMRISRTVAEDGGLGRSSLPAARLLRANHDSANYFWMFTLLVELLFWLLFYIL